LEGFMASNFPIDQHRSKLEHDKIVKYLNENLLRAEEVNKMITEKIVAWVLKRYEGLTISSLLKDDQLKYQGLNENKLVKTFKIQVDRCGTHIELRLKNVDSLMGLQDGVLLFPPKEAKPDIWMKQGDTFCGIQVRNLQDHFVPHSFRDAIYTLNPKNFFEGCSNELKEWGIFWHKNDTSFQSSYIRIVVSVKGFHQEVIASVRSHNLKNALTPILLLNLDESNIGILAYNEKLVNQSFTADGFTSVKLESYLPIPSAPIPELEKESTLLKKKKNSTFYQKADIAEGFDWDTQEIQSPLKKRQKEKDLKFEEDDDFMEN